MGTEVLHWTRDGTTFLVHAAHLNDTQLCLRQALGYLVGNIVFVSTLWYVMKRENRRRDRGERDDRLKGASEDVFLGDDDPRWRFQT